MEKAMSVEERIRRAEDIYNRRNGQYSRINVKEKATNNKKRNVVRKMITQILVCLLIYIVFYAITNKEYVFSEEFRNEVNATIEKLKINEAYSNVKAYIENNILKNKEQNPENGTENEKENPENQMPAGATETTSTTETTDATESTDAESTNTENTDTQNTENTTENQEEQNQDTPTDTSKIDTSENVGGAEEQTTESNSGEGELDEAAQMKKDAEDIKAKISFIVPVTGSISSTFGWRNPTTSTVPRYHTGLDIAAAEGTVIKSATDGKVVLASSEGDYGKHYQIQIEDVIIIYAHCKTLYLKEGDIVKQGQEIAEVGSTGNSTGPHLHFEIRKEERKVDPQLILNI